MRRTRFWILVAAGLTLTAFIGQFYSTLTNKNVEKDIDRAKGNCAYAHRPGPPTSSKQLEMEERRATLRRACSQYPIRRQLLVPETGLYYLSEKHNLSYCRVAKVGSTFWTQVFLSLADVRSQDGAGPDLESVLEMPRDESHELMKQYKNLMMEPNDNRVRTTTSFMVARNPYSRLFSSYIDQIYLPNKWEDAAKMVAGLRKDRCGGNVTFDEFLSSISTTLLKHSRVDLHWAPIFSICRPCVADFDILAKQETFNDDAEYILDRAHVNSTIRKKVSRVLRDNHVKNSIETLVHKYVTSGREIGSKCISDSRIAMRIWHAFQVQGHIHNKVDFPHILFADSKIQNLEERLATVMLENSQKIRLSSEERLKQREGWKIHFWKSVSKRTLGLVQDAFYEDFYAFGYNVHSIETLFETVK